MRPASISMVGAGQHTQRSVKMRSQKWITIASLVGAICFVVGIVWSAMVSASGHHPDALIRTAPISIISGIAGYVILPPVIETGLFTIILYLLRRITIHFAYCLPYLFISIMSMLGWVLHGPSWQSLGQGLNFGLLSALCWYIYGHLGYGGSYLWTAWAHGTWNGIIFIVWLLRTKT